LELVVIADWFVVDCVCCCCCCCCCCGGWVDCVFLDLFFSYGSTEYFLLTIPGLLGLKNGY
jgi:hypothetical protein